jgi:hypothetical protein
MSDQNPSEDDEGSAVPGAGVSIEANAGVAQVRATASDAPGGTDSATASVSRADEPLPPPPPQVIQSRRPTPPQFFRQQRSRVIPAPPPAQVAEEQDEAGIVALAGSASAVATAHDATLDVTEEPDVLEAQETVGSSDQATTGLLTVGASVAAGSVSDQVAMEATHTQTPSLNAEVIRALAAPPTLDDATVAELVAVVPHDVMADLEAVIVRLGQQLEERRELDEHVHEMQAALMTLRAQLSSPKPKRLTVSSALWSVTCWAAGFGNNVLANAAYDVLKRVLGH